MTPTSWTGRVAVWSARHRWRVIAAWMLVLAAVSMASAITGGVFTTDTEFTNNPESQQARRVLVQLRGSEPLGETAIVRNPALTVDDPAFRAQVDAIVKELRAHPDAIEPTSVVSFYEAQVPELVSRDRHATLIPLALTGTLDDSAAKVDMLQRVLGEREQPGFTVVEGGFASINEAFNTAAQKDLRSEERVLPIALAILVVVFGALLAAFVPMVVAFLAIGIAMGVITLLSQIWPLSTFVMNMVLMIGLAVGIDYTLLVVERFREERRRGRPIEGALGLAGDTATRAVVFSGATVVIALLGMLIVPTTIFRSFGLGSSIVAILAVAIALTGLPAALSLLGDRINLVRPRSAFLGAMIGGVTAGVVGGIAGTALPSTATAIVAAVAGIAVAIGATPLLVRALDTRNWFGLPLFRQSTTTAEPHRFWGAVARRVMARPVVSMVAATTLLIVLALPYAKVQLGASGAASIPESFQARQAFDILNADFSAGRLAPTEIVVEAANVNTAPVQQAVGKLLAAFKADGRIQVIAQPLVSPRADALVLTVSVPGDVASSDAIDTIKRIRTDYVPAAFAGVDAHALVGGQTALNSDFFDLVDTYTPIVFTFVLGMSFVLLLLVFRSLVVPLKAIIMNLLSVGAAYGVLVAIFQLGWGSSFLPFQTVDKIEAWLPLFMFTVLFGLSMDYHVFLLSRIRERFDETRRNAESVEFGVRSTANIITGAALIMIVVFSGFAFGQLVMFQQIGLGLAVAIFLDASVVRTVLVPATMRLLGDWNWYLPSWLGWLPDLRVEGGPATPEREAAAV